MLELTRLNGHRLLLNPDLIQSAEPVPDTTLTLVTGEKLIIRESCDELLEVVAAHRAAILCRAWPDAVSALAARAAHQ